MRLVNVITVLSILMSLSLFVPGGNVAFSQTNTPLTADAGDNITITTDEVNSTVIMGVVTDSGSGSFLKCAWEKGLDQLGPLMDVGPGGECPLALADFAGYFETGVYTMYVSAYDGTVVAWDEMILTIVDPNSAPVANAGVDMTITTDEFNATVIMGTVTDADPNDSLNCSWEKESEQLGPMIEVGPNGECPLVLADYSSQFTTGVYTMYVSGYDGTLLASDEMVLTIIEANAPPVADAGIDIAIVSEEIATTIIEGYVKDPNSSDALSCRWMEGVTQLSPWAPAGLNGECFLSLISLPIGVGSHLLTLDVDDGQTRSSDNVLLTVNNSTPVADAGTTTSSLTCMATSCDITLDGSQSTDYDNDIVSYEWISNNVAIAQGMTAITTLSLGIHDITLRVTDLAGNTDEALIQVVIEPAALSFIDINKAKLNWIDGTLRIKGKIALPAGVSYLTTNSVGSAAISLASSGSLVSESVSFTPHGNGKKWKYHTNTDMGIRKFKIDWKGERFKYKENCVEIKSHHFGVDSTTVEVEFCNKSIGPVTVDFGGGVSVYLDETGTASVLGLLPTEYEIENDDSEVEAEVVLPFLISPTDTISISGTVNKLVQVADYYKAAVGKFKINARFDPSIVDPSLQDPSLIVDISLGDEGFYGVIGIDPEIWTKKGNKKVKYERHD